MDLINSAFSEVKPVFAKIVKQQGQAILNAIITSGVLGVISVVMLQQVEQSNKELYLPRIKAAQSIAESRVKTLLLSPSSFVDCGTARGNCRLREDLFTGTELGDFVFDQASLNFNPSTRLFTGQLNYTGTNLQVSVASSTVQFEVPSEILVASQFICPDHTPIFRRFGPNGSPVCDAFPSGSLTCPTGQYVVRIDPNTLQVTCRSFSGMLSCPITQVISQVNWSGSDQNSGFQVQCQNRADVFEFSNFDPSLAAVVQGTAQGAPRNGRHGVPPDAPKPDEYVAYENCSIATSTSTSTTSTTTSTTTPTTTTTIPIPNVYAGCAVDTINWDIVSDGNCEAEDRETTTRTILFSVGTERASGVGGDNWVFTNPSDFNVTCTGACGTYTYSGAGGSATSNYSVTHIPSGTNWAFSVKGSARMMRTKGGHAR
jgi:hypothetical protein